jgi:endoglucanase
MLATFFGMNSSNRKTLMNNKFDVFEQNQCLGRGVNIIGYDEVLWKSRDLGRMRDKHFKQIKQAGFNHVRINLHPFKHMDDLPPYTIRSEWFQTLDWAVTQALDNGLIVILDMHQFNAMGQDPVGLKFKFLAVWEQLAVRYQESPNTVLFELLNEPNGLLTPALWNDLLMEAYHIIRRTNPNRTLIIGPAFWNGIDHLNELELPEGDQNIIATVHYYHPMPFTHQGAPWSKHRDETGVEWRGTQEEQQRIIADFEKAQVWAKQHNRPILLGEFGVYDRADIASRVCYTNFVARHAEQLGWSWSYWQFDSDFVVYDIDQDCWVTPIRDALIPVSYA